MIKTLCVPILLLFSGLSLSQVQPTLAEVLQQENIPASGLPATVLVQRTTSYASLNQPQRFVIAYYADHDGVLGFPLLVMMYDRKLRKWNSTQLPSANAGAQPELQSDCLGSITEIETVGPLLAINIHLNPSAECTILLTAELKPQNTLYGWIAAKTQNGQALIQHSEVHLAPTHPLELSVYDPVSNSLTRIYPSPNAPLRNEYVAGLRANLSLDWCRENNSHCDPELFGANLEQVTVGEDPASFAIQVQFEPTGYGSGAERTVGTKRLIYLFARVDERWESREFDAQSFSGTLEDAVTPATITKLFKSVGPLNAP